MCRIPRNEPKKQNILRECNQPLSKSHTNSNERVINHHRFRLISFLLRLLQSRIELESNRGVNMYKNGNDHVSVDDNIFQLISSNEMGRGRGRSREKESE